MLEQRMVEEAYPLLLKLMGEYGHMKTVLKIDKALKTSIHDKAEAMSIEILSTGMMYVRFNNRIDVEVRLMKTKKCPVLSYISSPSWGRIAEPDTYIRYCSAIVAELEKYKKLERDAEIVLERLDSFNRPLTRQILTEKIR
jgi:hypothetical protein